MKRAPENKLFKEFSSLLPYEVECQKEAVAALEEEYYDEEEYDKEEEGKEEEDEDKEEKEDQ